MTANASRPSEFAPSNAAATKNRQLAYLGQQLGDLERKLRKLDEELEVAARQHVGIRDFGVMQASLWVLEMPLQVLRERAHGFGDRFQAATRTMTPHRQ